jgi:hypothetical protein
MKASVITLLLLLIAHSAFALNTSEELLKESARKETIWANAWGITWSAVTAGQLAGAVITNDSETRTDLYIGAASSVLGIFPTLIFRPRVIGEYHKLSQKNASHSEYEAALIRDREDKLLRRGVFAHFGNVGANLAISAIMGFGYGHWPSAILSSGLGIPVGAFMIWSQPTTGLDHDERSFKVGFQSSTEKKTLLLSFAF